MRDVSESIQQLLNQKQGAETHIVIGVTWVDGSEVFYSSHEIAGALQNLVSISGLDITQTVEGSGSSQNVTVVLSDTSGDVKNILDTIDIHKRPAKIYLSFAGAPIDQSLLLIDGEINSDMSYVDSARTLTFTVLSKMEGRPFGFAAEDGLFYKVDQNRRTKAWPFRFGHTCDYPAIEIRNGIKGFLRLGQGVVSPTLDTEICQAQMINCPLVPPEDQITDPSVLPDTDNLAFARRKALEEQAESGFGFTPTSSYGASPQFGYFTVSTACGDQSNSLEFANASVPGGGTEGATCTKANLDPIPDPQCERDKFKKLCQLLRDRANQLQWVNPTLIIGNSEDFPNNREIQIRVGSDTIYTGTLVGETFTINGETRLDAPDNPDCETVAEPTYGYRKRSELEPKNLEECENPSATGFELQIVGGAGEGFRRLDEMETGDFLWLPAGTEVVLDETATRVHIVSMIPGTVTAVKAYRQFGDTRVLTEVPTDRYVVVTTDYGDLEVEELWLDRALSSYQDEAWSDTVYVSFEADSEYINPADCIQWIVENYTDFTVDATSFAAVKTLLTKYPCNYYHTTKRNVIDVLRKMAYEARCALTINDNVVKITYLPKEPDSLRTLTSSDVVLNSLAFQLTRTEALETSNRVTWQAGGAKSIVTESVVESFTVQNNVDKYGFFGGSLVLDTINNEPQALKTATFWSIRDSNTWHIVNFSCALENIDLEVFDCVTLDMPGFPTGKIIIQKVSFDPDTNTVDISAWTPILSGTTEEYFWAWPATRPAAEPYPTNSFDIDAPTISITPPTFHPLYVDPQGNEVAPPTTGDEFPSDIDDTLYVTECNEGTDAEIVDTFEPEFADIEFINLDSAADRADAASNNSIGGSANTEQPKETRACGEVTTSPGCLYEVLVQYSKATIIAQGSGTGFDCALEPGNCSITKHGARCGGGTFFWCRTFGSSRMAEAFVATIQTQIENNYCDWLTGNTGPVDVIGPTSVKSEDPAGVPCEDVGDVETHSPTPLLPP